MAGKRGPKRWHWYATSTAASCKACGAGWGSVFDVYEDEKCPECGFTDADAREKERLDRAQQGVDRE